MSVVAFLSNSTSRFDYQFENFLAVLVQLVVSSESLVSLKLWVCIFRSLLLLFGFFSLSRFDILDVLGYC